ncbi:hypothetical protein PICMEDRAFT_176306 [Pichia membranifaciens NRRL Y-2026]|uniref:Uncharacterized protein n=1 Tax=Pichia membranifaciens NRRL Y-2026 TaxID=763406 RepID=A0A1E3NF89_9ASCO|nr:hypothetical protein PICMEDRAFT_176306 [Pichia membranifaciens NRRL Y-2026]ODQ44756.1 hypothetical protein PICMEDRAFT_176306 [Pichia membranifaciens NRRL Y-2026]
MCTAWNFRCVCARLLPAGLVAALHLQFPLPAADMAIVYDRGIRAAAGHDDVSARRAAQRKIVYNREGKKKKRRLQCGVKRRPCAGAAAADGRCRRRIAAGDWSVDAGPRPGRRRQRLSQRFGPWSGRRRVGASESRYRRQGGAAEPTPISAAREGEGKNGRIERRGREEWVDSVYKCILIRLECIRRSCIRKCGGPSRGPESSGAET